MENFNDDQRYILHFIVTLVTRVRMSYSQCFYRCSAKSLLCKLKIRFERVQIEI